MSKATLCEQKVFSFLLLFSFVHKRKEESPPHSVKWVWLKIWSSQKQWYPAHLEQ